MAPPSGTLTVSLPLERVAARARVLATAGAHRRERHDLSRSGACGSLPRGGRRLKTHALPGGTRCELQVAGKVRQLLDLASP